MWNILTNFERMIKSGKMEQMVRNYSNAPSFTTSYVTLIRLIMLTPSQIVHACISLQSSEA